MLICLLFISHLNIHIHTLVHMGDAVFHAWWFCPALEDFVQLCAPQDPLNYGILASSSPSCHLQQQTTHHHITSVTRHTQTEHHVPKWRQLLYCLTGDEAYRRYRQREAAYAAAVRASKCTRNGGITSRHVNSVSYIDKTARILFPASFGLLNLLYWVAYYTYPEEFSWRDPPNAKFSH